MTGKSDLNSEFSHSLEAQTRTNGLRREVPGSWLTPIFFLSPSSVLNCEGPFLHAWGQPSPHIQASNTPLQTATAWIPTWGLLGPRSWHGVIQPVLHSSRALECGLEWEPCIPGGHVLLGSVGKDTDGRGPEKHPLQQGPRAGPMVELVFELRSSDWLQSPEAEPLNNCQSTTKHQV